IDRESLFAYDDAPGKNLPGASSFRFASERYRSCTFNGVSNRRLSHGSSVPERSRVMLLLRSLRVSLAAAALAAASVSMAQMPSRSMPARPMPARPMQAMPSTPMMPSTGQMMPMMPMLPTMPPFPFLPIVQTRTVPMIMPVGGYSNSAGTQSSAQYG